MKCIRYHGRYVKKCVMNWLHDSHRCQSPLLRWARKRAGMAQEDLAPRFRKLSEWENRETQSTFRQWEVFESTPDNILIHLRNILSSKEVDTEAHTKDFL